MPYAAVPRAIKRHPGWTYVVLTYALTWSISIPLVLSDNRVRGVDLPFALHYVAQFGPMLAALVVTGLVAGRAGLRELAGRVGRWRIGLTWWLVALSPVALFAVAAVAARAVDGSWPDLHEVGQLNFLPYLGAAVIPLWIITNGFGEEIGWRGFLLPHLQTGRGALKASLILWPIWAGWHIPAFFYVPSYKEMGVASAFGSIVFGVLAGTILLTWLYNSSGGSLLSVIVWHGLFNTFTASAAGHGTVAMVMSIAVMVWAVVIVLVTRPASLTGRRGRPTTPARRLERAGD